MILSQRLARKICPKCKTQKKLTAKEIALYGVADHFKTGGAVSYGKGCKACGNTGYEGRVPVFEWIRITESVKKALLNGLSSYELKKLARAEGMPDLRDSGLKLVKQGVTTLEEIEKLVTLGE
jgi:type II secretory ATPase GspE/PulE/Tfp pilus assembly ATPase PilB-like protein